MIIRRATKAELSQIIELLSDDDIGRKREVPEGGAKDVYEAAWAEMEQEPSNWIVVAMLGPEVLGMLQLTMIAGISRQGMKRAQIESVRVKSACRGRSIGRQLIHFDIATAREHGCGLVQLTTDKRRDDARSFYESLGFEATHEGMKLSIAKH
ncbi:GNAT family N-acetyltransferase [Acidovorax sp. FG27]|uniref:GNAT family N-acetyltransferase n=1 Tax=Acidovorax sp. FG27 TaxID=3133652 RepID=UPI003341B432